MGISLTAGMRANLTNLQSTAKMMEQTAVRLNTGKKVNSALDDPISYFTAREHMNRSSDLATLKNGMGESIQTITSANNGIESITSLLEAAKAKAESAKSVDAGSGFITQSLDLSGVEIGDEVVIGGDTFTAAAASDAAAGEFKVGDTDSATAAELSAIINATTETDNDMEVTNINNSQLTIKRADDSDMVAGDITIASAYENNFSEAFIAASDELSQLQTQYNELLNQIDTLQSDSGYKGVNLLQASDTLTVKFEGSNNLTINGFDADSNSLGVTDATWTDGGSITGDITKLDDAISTLESKASSLASSLSIVTTRQDFTTNMINTLITGADNLTLADMNEEGANMLMLQTQQSLGANSLNMAAQTAQSVLRLF